MPQGQNWKVTSIVLRGFLDQFTHPAFTLNLAFRRNGTGQPGAVIQTYTLTPAEVTPPQTELGFHNYRFDLPEAIQFEPGTYWVQSQCSAEIFECGMGPVIGQHSMGTTDGGANWTLSPFNITEDAGDMSVGLLGTAETAATLTTGLETSVGQLGIDHGTFVSLNAKLDAVLADLASGNTATACNDLQSFINLTAAQTGKKLTTDQATALINEASRIRGLLGC